MITPFDRRCVMLAEDVPIGLASLPAPHYVPCMHTRWFRTWANCCSAKNIMKHKRAILICVAAVVILDVGFRLLQWRQATCVVEKWKTRLESSLSSSASFEDARQCLESNGFDVAAVELHTYQREWIGLEEHCSDKETV